MEVNSEFIMQVIDKLVGKIDPCADSSIDSKRIKNLKVYLAVLEEMHGNVVDILRVHHDSPYGSVWPFIEECKKTLNRIEDNGF